MLISWYYINVIFLHSFNNSYECKSVAGGGINGSKYLGTRFGGCITTIHSPTTNFLVWSTSFLPPFSKWERGHRFSCNDTITIMSRSGTANGRMAPGRKSTRTASRASCNRSYMAVQNGLHTLNSSSRTNIFFNLTLLQVGAVRIKD